MARKPRLHVPGGLYHVMLRGNGGQDIFSDDEDRYHLYLLIQQGVERYGHQVHGFCCMTNHIHLAIQVAEDPLSGQGKKRVIDRSFMEKSGQIYF
jgi:putative transposase